MALDKTCVHMCVHVCVHGHAMYMCVHVCVHGHAVYICMCVVYTRRSYSRRERDLVVDVVHTQLD